MCHSTQAKLLEKASESVIKSLIFKFWLKLLVEEFDVSKAGGLNWKVTSSVFLLDVNFSDSFATTFVVYKILC